MMLAEDVALSLTACEVDEFDGTLGVVTITERGAEVDEEGQSHARFSKKTYISVDRHLASRRVKHLISLCVFTITYEDTTFCFGVQLLAKM